MKSNVVDIAQKPTEGFFKIEYLDNNENVLYTYEQKNMIMSKSKASVANSTLGTTPQIDYINKIVLGNAGHETSNLLVNKSFAYTRTRLFAEDRSNINDRIYPIIFDPLSIAGDFSIPVTGEDETNVVKATPSTVSAKIVDNSTIEYVFSIPEANANGTGVAAWTEAALYTKRGEILNTNPIVSGNIFAMRTFPAKVKENTSVFRITWRIVF